MIVDISGIGAVGGLSTNQDFKVNVHRLAAVLVFLMSSPESLLIEKLLMKNNKS